MQTTFNLVEYLLA